MKVVAVLVVAVAVVCCGRRHNSSSCKSGFTKIAGKCYLFIYSEESWEGAMEKCQQEDAELASVITEDQYDGLLEYINTSNPGKYWISGRVQSGRWVWTPSGKPMEPKWWGRSPSTSGDQCAYFCSNTKKYWDAHCTNAHRFICEKNMNQ